MADPNDKELEQYFDYARSLAGQIARRLPSHVDREDIEAAGLQGLVEAWRRFDPLHGAAFKTFAYHRVRGAVFDWLRSSTWMTAQDWKVLNQGEAIDEISEAQGGDLTSASFAELVGRAQDAARQIAVTVVLSEVQSDSEDGMPEVEGIETHGPDELAATTELHARVRDAIQGLPDDERDVIRMRFFEHKSVTEIGKLLGIHKSNVTRKCQKAYGLLEQELGALMRA
ncbi:MAG: sigma-70 family RNA polymerase sigma factor [Planctomycetes bacterium]|nr:sigma-70 family RNA polymerase sigma factor [Planctomycetota bacterium]MCB9917313.1 sigma-70 family RNA polymerase sigma factor [Planctomycetota bacterium]